MGFVADRFRRRAVVSALALSMAVPAAASAEPMRIAFGDIATIETLGLLIAMERAKEQGVEIEPTFLKSEDIAAQAVVSGQADIGIGGPYALLQKVKAPIRIFLQLSELQMYPVVNTEFYKTWADLDGQEIAVHSRGSGTEAIMQMMADKQGIEYSSIAYVPGAEVRTGALLQGNIKATIVDSSGKRILESEAPDRFAFLPLDGVEATDEAMFANTEYLAENPEDVSALVEAIVTTWREIAADPTVVARLRDQYNLLPDATPEMLADIEPYYSGMKDALPMNGGGEAAAKGDFAFYTASGALEGNAEDLKVEDFWDLSVLDGVLDKIGTQ
ncbi:ABC transporter substrate-binding protein [Paracoccus sediminis]|uniref:ABC transporter substrate-binding protein n=2 Tax=Paracoccus sediminis TaxID=1214787 RepID=A0A238WWU5_9RHOB|nr:ABC transporter substrate-binding protein [Paracoccus sediminis]SNR50821.1 NitT/TauT family transport system substrate-binding protein [Paracoccus sediminis]